MIKKNVLHVVSYGSAEQAEEMFNLLYRSSGETGVRVLKEGEEIKFLPVEPFFLNIVGFATKGFLWVQRLFEKAMSIFNSVVRT